MKTVNIGIIGFGTVGAGVAEAILKNGSLIAKRVGFTPVLRKIADLDITTDRGVELPAGILTTDATAVADDPEIQIVVELVGGTTFAKDIILRALANGKSVVTANKALLATAGAELFAMAQAHGADIGFEASVGGGIPCIKALREGLAANQIKEILGILNGTCNYILTRMETERADFDDVLAAAQAAGYAEANPALDVDGHDTAHKAAVLASLAFGKWFKAEDVYVQGIRSVTINDIEHAARLGYRIKLLAIIKEIDRRIQLGVHPALVPVKSLLGNVNGVFNAVWINGDIVGNTMYYGRGAGRAATSSAVVADLVDIGLNLLNDCPRRLPAFPVFKQYDGLMGSADIVSRFYVRLQIADRPGVLAKVSGVLGKHGISLASVTQKEVDQPSVPMIILTHQAHEADIQNALAEIDLLDDVFEKPVLFRIEDVE
ncbi:MAG: homoserine dehydrogenase [Lentisphaeria bacterium]|nr:homoserine dehydrogenase [Lentisphaeria bacterium]